jgi:hypothetical protein
MNVAGVITTIVAVPSADETSRSGRRADEAAVLEAIGPTIALGGGERQLGFALRDFSAAVARGEAAELLNLLTPVPIDTWIRRGAPGIPRLRLGDYAAMRPSWGVPVREGALVRALRAGPHLEARLLGDDVVITPQHGGRPELSVDVLMPVRREGVVRLRPVRAPLDEHGWLDVAERLRAASDRAASEAEDAMQADCEDVLVRGPEGRWQSGCASAACGGTCHLIDAGIDRGVDVFGCVCSLDDDARTERERA